MWVSWAGKPAACVKVSAKCLCVWQEHLKGANYKMKREDGWVLFNRYQTCWECVEGLISDASWTPQGQAYLLKWALNTVVLFIIMKRLPFSAVEYQSCSPACQGRQHVGWKQRDLLQLRICANVCGRVKTCITVVWLPLRQICHGWIPFNSVQLTIKAAQLSFSKLRDNCVVFCWQTVASNPRFLN